MIFRIQLNSPNMVNMELNHDPEAGGAVIKLFKTTENGFQDR